MKITQLLLVGSLFLGISAMALSAKVEKPVLVKGTSVGQYAKPGAPVEISYTSEQVSVGDVANVDINLTSSVTTGTMKVKVKVDKDLYEITQVDKHLSFDLSKGEKEYPLHLEVSAEVDGLYYVRVMVTIKGKGMRSFAVPVYVGKGTLRKNKVKLEKTKSGENISVFSAEETIIN